MKHIETIMPSVVTQMYQTRYKYLCSIASMFGVETMSDEEQAEMLKLQAIFQK